MTQMLTKLELPIQGWIFIQDLSPVLTTRGYYGNVLTTRGYYGNVLTTRGYYGNVLTTRGYYGNDQLRNITFTFRSNPLTR